MFLNLSQRLILSFYAMIVLLCIAPCKAQVTNPPSTLLGELNERIQASLTSQLPEVSKVAILKKYEESVLDLRSRVLKEAGGRQKFGNELLYISERYFSLAAFEESDRLNAAIANEFQNDIIGAVANSRLAYSQQTVGRNRAAANEYYEKALRHFRGMDLENDLTAAYAAVMSMNNAADNYLLQGRDGEAEQLFRFILDSPELSNAALPGVRLNAANELGFLLRKKGDLEAAAERFREATSFVENSLHPDAFKDKLLMSLWESEMDARFRSLNSTESKAKDFQLDTVGLEEIWLGLKDKRKGLGVRVGSTLLLCYRFNKKPDAQLQLEKIPDVAEEIIAIIGENPDPQSADYLYSIQARLLWIEELSRVRSPDFHKGLTAYRDERKRADSREFVPVVSSRFPDHEEVEKSLKKIDAELAQPKLAEPKQRKNEKIEDGK